MFKKILTIEKIKSLKVLKIKKKKEKKIESLKICLSKKLGLKLSFKDRQRCAAFNLKWKRVPEVRRAH